MVVYYYLIFSCASKELRLSASFKQAIYFVRMLSTAVYMLVLAIFLLQPNCGEPVLMLAGIAYGTAVMVLFPYDWYSTECALEAERQMKLRSEIEGRLHRLNSVVNPTAMQQQQKRHNSISYTAAGH